MSCYGSHTWRVTIYTQEHPRTNSMQAILIEEILPEIPVPSDWTLGRQRLGNWQISSNHPIASTKENKAWKRIEREKGALHGHTGISIRGQHPFQHLSRLEHTTWTDCCLGPTKPTFADATNFSPSLSHSDFPTWAWDLPLG